MTEYSIGQLVRVYWRTDLNQWQEFQVQDINEHNEPIDPDGNSYPLSNWVQYRSTGFRENTDHYATFRNKHFKHWRCRLHVKGETNQGWLINPYTDDLLPNREWELEHH